MLYMLLAKGIVLLDTLDCGFRYLFYSKVSDRSINREIHCCLTFGHTLEGGGVEVPKAATELVHKLRSGENNSSAN